MNLGSLFINLGVNADTYTVRDFNESIKDIPLSAVAAITSMSGLSLEFTNLSRSLMDMTSGLQNFTAETGLNTDELMKWEMAAQRLGMQASVAEGFIRKISSAMASLHTSRPDVNFLGMLSQLGVKDISGNAYDIANRIQEAAKTHPRATSESLLSAAGMSGVMHLFDMPKSERDDLRPTINSGQQAQLAEITKALAELKTDVLRDFAHVLIDLKPALIEFIHALGWFSHKGLKAADVFFSPDQHPEYDMIPSSETMRNMWKGGDKTVNQTINMHVNGVVNPHDLTEQVYRIMNKGQLMSLKAFNNGGS